MNIGKGEQFKEFLAISPNNRIPAMVDHDPPGGGAPMAVFKSGAMLLYLADKTGKFIPKDIRGRTDTVQWLFWQMGNLGPMSGQNNHFSNYAVDKIQYAMDLTERGEPALRAVGSLTAPTWRVITRSRHGELSWVALHERRRRYFPHVKRWLRCDQVAAGGGVRLRHGGTRTGAPAPGERAILFGQTAVSVKALRGEMATCTLQYLLQSCSSYSASWRAPPRSGRTTRSIGSAFWSVRPIFRRAARSGSPTWTRDLGGDMLVFTLIGLVVGIRSAECRHGRKPRGWPGQAMRLDAAAADRALHPVQRWPTSKPGSQRART